MLVRGALDGQLGLSVLESLSAELLSGSLSHSLLLNTAFKAAVVDCLGSFGVTVIGGGEVTVV